MNAISSVENLTFLYPSKSWIKPVVYLLILEIIISCLALLSQQPMVVLGLVVATISLFIFVVNPTWFIMILLFLILSMPAGQYPETGFYSFNIGTRTAFIIEVMILSGLFLWLLKTSLKGEVLRFHLRVPDSLLLIFLALYFLSIAKGFVSGRTLSNIIWDSRMIIFSGVYFLISRIVKNEVQIHRIILVMFLASILLLLYYVIMNISGVYFIHTEIPGGTAREHAFVFASMFIISLGLALYLSDMKPLFLFASISFIFFALLTFQRANYIHIALSLLSIFYLVERKYRKIFLKWCFLGFFVFAIIGIIYTPARQFFGATGSRIEDIGEIHSDLSILQRLFEYNFALNRIKEHPVLGVGMGYELSYLVPYIGIPIKWTAVHNEFLWLTLKAGIPALLIFISLLVYLVKKGKELYPKISDPVMKGFFLGIWSNLIGLIGKSQFADEFHKHRPGFLLWVMLGLIVAFDRIYGEKKSLS